ncbi:hypothetical protein ABK905_02360 [Acerihabitans sp. KWT182]|uniref:Uncharacterized protein n=1 Tax=Acerihabitans sp. KWT182 TaxID=3157919 RepID=A0AAU7QD84_9GAMM
MANHYFIISNNCYFNDKPQSSPEMKRGMSKSLRQVYNSAMPGMFSWMTAITGGVITTLPACLSCSAISHAVVNVNHSLFSLQAEPRHVLNELINIGLRYGAAGGAITGLSAALLINQCVKINNRAQYYDQPRDILLGLGGLLGLVIGGLSGAVYSISLHQNYADYDDKLRINYFSS